MNTATRVSTQLPVAQAPDDSLLARLVDAAHLADDAETRAVARLGVEVFVQAMLRPEHAGQRIDRGAIDLLIAEIDARIGAQVNVLLHAPAVQRLEATWRELKLLVDRVDFRENIQVEVLHLPKEELAADFDDAPELTRSGLHRIVYASEYGTFGGSPYGAIVATYELDHGPADMQLLRACAGVAAMAHAPFLANASPAFFGMPSFLELPRLKDLHAQLDGPQYARWSAFRDSEDARYVGLCLPRFLLRLPYQQDTVPSRSFHFEEDVNGKHAHHLWGHASIALAIRVADSFAKYRWCPNIIGPTSGGAIDGLPLHTYEAMGALETKIPTEIQLTERREYELSEEGFIGLVYRKGTDNACFFSANSPQRPKTFGGSDGGRAAETNHRLGTQLPYMFIVSRLAHYIKVLERERIGSTRERADLERELNRWITQYVVTMDAPSAAVRAQRPLREAQVTVEDVPGQAGWYRCNLRVRPHFKYMGADFTLSLVGKLDK